MFTVTTNETESQIRHSDKCLLLKSWGWITFLTPQRNSRKRASKIQFSKALFSLSNCKSGLPVLAVSASFITHLLQFATKQLRDCKGSSSLFFSAAAEQFSSLHWMSKRSRSDVVCSMSSVKTLSLMHTHNGADQVAGTVLFLTSPNFAWLHNLKTIHLVETGVWGMGWRYDVVLYHGVVDVNLLAFRAN